MGQQAAAEVEQRYRTAEDALLTRIGQQLAAVSDETGYPYRFRVIEREQVNAFALPGGPVYITTGMMEFTRGRPDELAAEMRLIRVRGGYKSMHRARRPA